MSQISVERTIDLSPSKLWDALKNLGTIQNFHPAVKESYNLTTVTGGLGAERQCNFHDGNWVKERVIAWEEGKRMDISIFEGSMPVKDAKATITLHPNSAAQTRVTFDMEYTPKMGPLGVVMDKLMMRSKFGSMLDSVLAGLETHVSTGVVVGKDGQPDHELQVAA